MLSDTEMELESPGGSSSRSSFGSARSSLGGAGGRRSSSGTAATRSSLGGMARTPLGFVDSAVNSARPSLSIPQGKKEMLTLASVVERLATLDAAQQAKDDMRVAAGFEPAKASFNLRRTRAVLV